MILARFPAGATVEVLTFGSLFAGIGGFDLGLERAGMHCLWQCEINPDCQRVLADHWPDVLRVPDVRDVRADTVAPVDVICGGFPCQPVSDAGLKLAQNDKRWLWPEFARVVRELRPRYVLVENVPGLLARGMGDVLGDLAACGYDAEWDCVSAADVGAPHLRERVWLVAYPASWHEPQEQEGDAVEHGQRTSNGRREQLTSGTRASGRAGGRDRAPGARGRSTGPLAPGDESDVAHAHEERRDWRPRVFGTGWRAELEDCRRAVQDTDRGAVLARWERGRAPQAGSPEWWAVEPPVGRVAHGVPARLAQLAALGNAVIPVIPELIGRRIIDYEEGRLAA